MACTVDKNASGQLDHYAAVPDAFAVAMIHCSLNRFKIDNKFEFLQAHQNRTSGG